MSTYMLNQIIYRDIEMIVIKFKSFLEKPYYAVHNFCIKKKIQTYPFYQPLNQRRSTEHPCLCHT